MKAFKITEARKRRLVEVYVGVEQQFGSHMLWIAQIVHGGLAERAS